MKEISRLKLKFMFYNMLIVTTVIGVTFLMAAMVAKKRGIQEINTVLTSTVVENEPGTLVFEGSSQVRIPRFSVIVEPDGAVLLRDGAYNSFSSRGFLEQVALLTLDKEEELGLLEDYHLRYMKVEHPSGSLIAFADTTYEDTLFSGLLRTGGIACIAIWLGCFVLSYFFARWAVRPVEESIRMQKQFVADASHELKTPLTIITANGELLKERCRGISEEVDKWLDHIDQECHEMRRLVEDLLTLAKNDGAEKERKNWETLNLSDLLMEQVLSFEPVFYQAGKYMESDLEEELFVKGNQAQLKRAVTVLLDNAVKYSKNEGKTQIVLKRSGRRRAYIWVKSEGEEIPKEKREVIFRRFYRGESSRSGPAGYGLGLSIAREIVKNHRAQIGVTWEDGKNCFYIKMKLLRGKKS